MQVLVSCDYLSSLLAGQMRIRLKLHFLRVTDFCTPCRNGTIFLTLIMNYIYVFQVVEENLFRNYRVCVAPYSHLKFTSLDIKC